MFGVGSANARKFVLPVKDLDRPVEVHRHPRARRMTLRVSHTKRTVRLTVPRSVGKLEANAFINQHLDWLKQQIHDLPENVPFADQAVFPLEGEMCRILFVDRLPGRRSVLLEDTADGKIMRVDNSLGDGPERVLGWLKQRARSVLLEASRKHADRLGLSFARISVRDQSTRWGSCSSNGTLSFSWRLILAPDYVLDYVCAHEVAHLEEMNHSSRFWKLVERTLPDYDRARIWLRENGGVLHCYGAQK